MIITNRRTLIFMCKEPTDMRLGYNGLYKKAKQFFRQDPSRGQYFIFINRRRTSCKIYTSDGSGEIVISKRLYQGLFCRPNPNYKKNIRITGSEFTQFLEGLNVSGRILESTPARSSRKKILPFIPSYRKLTSYEGRENINKK